MTAIINEASLNKIATKLRAEYGDFHHHNKKDPLDELIFIICSVKRREERYLLAFRDLKKAFPTYKKLAEAPLARIRDVLAPYGLQNEKALAIKEILKAVIKRFGRPTLSPLRRLDDKECEDFLLALRGVGKKVARCVMMYSLARQVFPVDSNCWRICHRLGLINWRHKVNATSSKDMDSLQARIPARLRVSLHSNMVSHGREICTVKNKKCGDCAVKDYCLRIV